MKMRDDEHLGERNRSLFEMLDSDLIRNLEESSGSRQQQENPTQIEFFILNYSMATFRAKYRDGMNMEKIRVNFAPHAFIFDGSQPGDNR